jgi:hemolysin activation/secretion protein
MTLGRGEGAIGEARFARASAELTLSQGIGRSTEASLTASTGSSAGDIPTQRLWYLGGPQTVRGFAPGALAGDAFWFGRLEISQGHPVARPSVFADAGWAGARALLTESSVPISGIGLGMTLMDGMVRFDVARSSRGRLRADLYLNPR